MIKQMDKKRIREDEKHVYFKTRFTKEGVINDGFQSKDELEKMIPYLNGLPVTVEHPRDDVVVYEHDKSYGHSVNVTLSNLNGVWVAEGEVGIKKEHVKLIENIEQGNTTNVSIGYSMERVEKPGTHNDKTYSHLRTNVMPFHLAILEREPPACPLPYCGIGTDKAKCENDCDACDNRKSLILENLYDEPLIKANEVETMTDNQHETPAPKPIPIHTMSVDALAQENSGIRKLVEEKDRLKKSLDESNTTAAELAKERDSLLPFKKFHDELLQKELDGLRAKVRETKVFEDATIEQMGKDELVHILKVRDSLVKSADPKAPHVRSGDSIEKIAAGFTVGFTDDEGKWKV